MDYFVHVVALGIIRCSTWPCAPNLTASLEIQICRCIGNTRTVVEALGLTYQNSKKLEELTESHQSRSPSSSVAEAEINDM